MYQVDQLRASPEVEAYRAMIKSVIPDFFAGKQTIKDFLENSGDIRRYPEALSTDLIYALGSEDGRQFTVRLFENDPGAGHGLTFSIRIPDFPFLSFAWHGPALDPYARSDRVYGQLARLFSFNFYPQYGPGGQPCLEMFALSKTARYRPDFDADGKADEDFLQHNDWPPGDYRIWEFSFDNSTGIVAMTFKGPQKSETISLPSKISRLERDLLISA